MKKVLGVGVIVVVCTFVFAAGVFSQSVAQSLLARVAPTLVNIKQDLPVTLTLTLEDDVDAGQTITVPVTLGLDLKLTLKSSMTGTVTVGEADDLEVSVGEADETAKVKDSELTAPRGDGFYLAGVEMAYGRWRGERGNDNCYWATRTKDNEYVNSHYGQSGGTIVISEAVYELEVSDCGTLTYLGE